MLNFILEIFFSIISIENYNYYKNDSKMYYCYTNPLKFYEKNKNLI